MQLRHRQPLAYAQPAQRLALARVVVKAKLEGQMATLGALGLGVPPLLREAAQCIATATSVVALRGKAGLARGVCCRELAADGFDPALGFLHEVAPPRAICCTTANGVASPCPTSAPSVTSARPIRRRSAR